MPMWNEANNSLQLLPPRWETRRAGEGHHTLHDGAAELREALAAPLAGGVDCNRGGHVTIVGANRSLPHRKRNSFSISR